MALVSVLNASSDLETVYLHVAYHERAGCWTQACNTGAAEQIEALSLWSTSNKAVHFNAN